MLFFLFSFSLFFHSFSLVVFSLSSCLFIVLEIGLLKALYFFDPLGFLLIKICNVPCFFILLFGKNLQFFEPKLEPNVTR